MTNRSQYRLNRIRIADDDFRIDFDLDSLDDQRDSRFDDIDNLNDVDRESGIVI